MKIQNTYTITRWVKVLLFYLFTFLPLNAQDSLLLRDYQFVRQSDPWLTHHNAAALTRFAADNIVDAEASLVKGNGGLVNYADSRNTLQGTVRAESFYRLSPRVVTYGAISYDNWTGRDMTGSAFMLQRTPFNLVEDSLTNPGRKHRDIYRLVGGVGADVYKGISLGARLDYTSGNYAKYKDLRHKNKLMDLQLSVGTYAALTDWLSVGADYFYRRQTESVDFGTYGKSERVYKTLIDYGAFMGRVEQFGNEGFTDKAREMPLFEDRHGASLQFELRPHIIHHPSAISPLALHVSVDASHASGYYGRRSPYTITYTNHDRDIFNFQGRLTYAVRSSRFTLDVNYSSEQLENRAETFREMTNAGGANYYEYYDAVETGTKKWYDLSTLFTAQWGIRGELPAWDLSAGYTRNERRQTAYLYPYLNGECGEVGMYLAMSRQADREGYPEIAEAFKRYAFEEAEHASKFAELLGDVLKDTKSNLEARIAAERGACEDKFRIARNAKKANMDATHDTVHEMAKDEARHCAGFQGLYNRYFKK